MYGIQTPSYPLRKYSEALQLVTQVQCSSSLAYTSDLSVRHSPLARPAALHRLDLRLAPHHPPKLPRQLGPIERRACRRRDVPQLVPGARADRALGQLRAGPGDGAEALLLLHLALRGVGARRLRGRGPLTAGPLLAGQRAVRLCLGAVGGEGVGQGGARGGGVDVGRSIGRFWVGIVSKGEGSRAKEARNTNWALSACR